MPTFTLRLRCPDCGAIVTWSDERPAAHASIATTTRRSRAARAWAKPSRMWTRGSRRRVDGHWRSTFSRARNTHADAGFAS